ncbi:MAG: gamma-glutamyl-gamma-aminobutyrate hydrolase family protein [Oleiphilaceae bacterium]|nr:gamma-glutamyl-gamma-aminobutyrate hydrolase family protein [Oleiphilaceae bacterium]
MAGRQNPVLIGVSGHGRNKADIALIRLALTLYGAETLWLLPGMTIPWARLHGVVIAGGSHVHPSRFRQKPQIAARYNLPRDELEFALARGANIRGVPVLGICRGAQVLNIARGGSLRQNITPDRVHTRPRALLLPLQPVRVQPRSRVARTLGRELLGANRLHSQAIERLGEGLKAVAMDRDGFVQAIEAKPVDSGQALWQLGVQWHPEYLLYHPSHRRLFAALVAAARRYRQGCANGSSATVTTT